MPNPRLHPLFDPDIVHGAQALQAEQATADWQARVEAEFLMIEQAMERQEQLLKRLIDVLVGPAR